MWKRSNTTEFVTYEKGDTQISLANGLVLIVPTDGEREDYFEHCDMMMTYIFAYTLYEIIGGGNGGRYIIHDCVTKDEAFWYLGILDLTMEDKGEIYKMCKEATDNAS